MSSFSTFLKSSKGGVQLLFTRMFSIAGTMYFVTGQGLKEPSFRFKIMRIKDAWQIEDAQLLPDWMTEVEEDIMAIVEKQENLAQKNRF